MVLVRNHRKKIGLKKKKEKGISSRKSRSQGPAFLKVACIFFFFHKKILSLVTEKDALRATGLRRGVNVQLLRESL